MIQVTDWSMTTFSPVLSTVDASADACADGHMGMPLVKHAAGPLNPGVVLPSYERLTWVQRWFTNPLLKVFRECDPPAGDGDF
jgi:hypothetical protein